METSVCEFRIVHATQNFNNIDGWPVDCLSVLESCLATLFFLGAHFWLIGRERDEKLQWSFIFICAATISMLLVLVVAHNWMGPTSQSIADILLTAEHNHRLFFLSFKHIWLTASASFWTTQAMKLYTGTVQCSWGILINWLMIPGTINCSQNQEMDRSDYDALPAIYITEKGYFN